MTRLIPALAVLVAACSGCVVNPCNPKTDVAYCDGNVRYACPEPGVDQLVADHWIRSDCAAKQQFCVTPEGGQAVCALATVPDPACAGDDLWAACESATVALSCNHGFATGRRSCRACVVDEARVLTCHGGFGAKCTSDDDCGPELACGDTGACGVHKAP